LASSVMLMLGDGNNSLDVLRQDKGNKNHGLDFKTGVVGNSAGKKYELLEKSNVEILSKGHFGLWYRCLPKSLDLYAKFEKSTDSVSLTTFDCFESYHSDDISKLIGNKSSILEYMTYLPDLFEVLWRYEIGPNGSSTNCEIFINDTKNHRRDQWSIHDAMTSESLSAILEIFSVPPGQESNIDYKTIDFQNEGFGGVIDYNWEKGQKDIPYTFPSSRISLNFESICYQKRITTLEFVDIYIVAYGLSMLARYFPDLWVTCLESNCLAAKLIERFSNVLVRKAPILALSLLHEEMYHIGTTRSAWSR